MSRHVSAIGGERTLATLEAVQRAVQSAVDTAEVDRDAPDGERVRFDREALRRVSEFYKAPSTQDQVIRSWRAVLRVLIDKEDLERALATVVLQDRLRGIRDVSYESIDGVWKRRAEDEIRDEDDPWLAERNW